MPPPSGHHQSSIQTGKGDLHRFYAGWERRYPLSTSPIRGDLTTLCTYLVQVGGAVSEASTSLRINQRSDVKGMKENDIVAFSALDHCALGPALRF